MSWRLESEEIRILRRIEKLLERLVKDERPHLAAVKIFFGETTMSASATLVVGQKTTATLQGFDQFGNPFPIDPSTVSWADDNNAVAASTPQADGSDVITGVAPGTANITATVGSLTDTAAITVVATQPQPVLSKIQISLSNPQ